MSNLFARLSSMESYRNSRGETEIREWTAPWCLNPQRNSSRIVFPLENVSSRSEELPVTFKTNKSSTSDSPRHVQYGQSANEQAVNYWGREQGEEFLTRLSQSKGATVFITLSNVDFDGGRSVAQGKLSFVDSRGLNVFEFNVDELTARKAEKYIKKAGGNPVYGTIDIDHAQGKMHTWYGTKGVDPTRNEVASWLDFVKKLGSENCKVTVVNEVGRAEAPLFIAEGPTERRCIYLPNYTHAAKIKGNLSLYSAFNVTTLETPDTADWPKTIRPEELFPDRVNSALYPKTTSEHR